MKTTSPIPAGRLAAALSLLVALPCAAFAADMNVVPYLSTYYIEPTVAVGSTVRIDYYVTDAEQGEYLRDESQTFTVDYWVNGVKTTLADVASGDRSLKFPAPPKGRALFALQATDREGRKSHRFFQEFRVVDPAEEAIKPEQVLTPDLARFGIHADNTHPVETTAGLTAMLKWASTNGYRKIVLPAGATFAIHYSNTVQMASGVTLDMNGSTFKLEPSFVNGSLMLEFVDCVDSHVVNGTFIGDLNERDFSDPKNHAEWVNCMSISQGSEYCTVEDVTIRDITGYGTCTNHRHSYDRSQPVKGFSPGDLDAQGQEVASETRVTSAGFTDIRTFVKTHGFFQLGIYLGYQGNPADHWVYRAHLYDVDQNFLETVEGYMYRRLHPRADAAFVRFTLLGTATPENLCVYNFRAPYNCAYRNIRHENIRCVGMALAGFNNMLVEGCTFENCGWKLAKCAFDAEDGWDMMQDLTFRGNVFGKNPVNEFLTCGGHNFVMEKNVMKAYIWDRTRSYVFRGNELKSANFRFATLKRTGYPRIVRNRIATGTTLVQAHEGPEKAFAIRENHCEGGVSVSGKAPWRTYFYRCQIAGGALNANVVDCDVTAVTNAGASFAIAGSRIKNSFLKSSGNDGVATITASQLADTACPVQGTTLIVSNSTLRNVVFPITGDWNTRHTIVLDGNTIETALPDLVNIGNTYNRISLRNNRIAATAPGFAAVHLRNPVKGDNPVVEAVNNTFAAESGWVVQADRPPSEGVPRTIRLSGNKLSGLAPVGDVLRDAASVRIDME